MNGSMDLESLLESLDDAEYDEYDEYDERRRGRSRPQGARGVRVPTRQSSLPPPVTRQPATQTQVQTAARNLDGKIETLSNAVKALESRTGSLAADQDRTAAAVGKALAERKKGTDGLRAELQQTRTLAVLLPLLTQRPVASEDADGRPVTVLTQQQGGLSTILPFLLLSSGSSGDGKGGILGGDIMPLLLITLLSDRR